MGFIEDAARLAAEQQASGEGAAEGQQENNNGGGNGQPAEQQATIDATKVFEYFDNNEGDLYQYVSKKLGRAA